MYYGLRPELKLSYPILSHLKIINELQGDKVNKIIIIIIIIIQHLYSAEYQLNVLVR